MLHLTWIDWIIILLYFVFILGIGFYLRRWSEGNEEFFLAGRSNSAWVSALAFLSANLGSLEILGWTGASVKYGILTAHFYWIGAVPAMLFLGVFMMKFYYKKNIYSVPGYVGARFDEKTRFVSAFSFAVMTLLMSGVNIYLMALILKIILGWNWHVSIWASALTVAIYVALGGLMSAIFTEVVQFFLVWFGLVLVGILGLIKIGGFGFLSELPQSLTSLWKITFDPSQNAMGITFWGIILGLGWVLSFGYWTTDFLVVQRAFASRDLESARLAPIIASFFKMALPFVVTFGGLIALRLIQIGEIQLLQDETGKVLYDSALPALISKYYEPGLFGLGITALLAGFMAGQAGNITAFNTVFTQDIYKPIFRPQAGERELVLVGRLSTVIGIFISVAAAYWAMKFPTIMDYIQAIFSWVNAPLFATILLGMFSKRITPSGAFWGLVVGMLFSFITFTGVRWGIIPAKFIALYDNPSEMSLNLWRAWWSWLITFVITILVSFFTKPKPENELIGLVRGVGSGSDDELQSSYKRPFFKKAEFWAIVSLAVLIALNIIFF
ncbi:MAG: sodium/solute symporter [Candidatus Calescibacterium sp.]|jgi:SSS family solute:Na+ symporter|nr:sodium/solute symporter [Candidatus Calescibacterium sp.]